MEQTAYHIPVLLKESVDALQIKPNGTYVDVTFGGGGHSTEIIKLLPEGRLFAFDQDLQAEANAVSIQHAGFKLVKANFRFLERYLNLYGAVKVDGILADLGISSHQIDEPERGFSTRFSGPLDMRMNESSETTAADLINSYSEADLKKIFGMYGEITNAGKLAMAIVRARVETKIETTDQLKQVVWNLAPKGKEFKYLAQVFQALRIEVNEELEALKALLEQSARVLNKGGRLVVISYHSLEDRLVKNFIQKGKFDGEVEKDIYGNEIKPLSSVNRKIIEPLYAEIERNPRSRSAKLRIAEKN